MAATPTGIQSQLAAQDSTRVLQQIFTGHVVGQPAMGYSPLMAKVLGPGTAAGTVVVTITGFGGSTTPGGVPSFVCRYAGTTAPAPASACCIAFPTNDPQGVGIVLVALG